MNLINTIRNLYNENLDDKVKNELIEQNISEAPEDKEPASPDEKSMALKQVEFISYAAREIKEHIQGNKEFPEWFQNKLSKAHRDMESLHSSMGEHGQQDESTMPYTDEEADLLSEDDFSKGDKVKCKASGKTGIVTAVDPSGKGKYYTVKRDDDAVMKYAPDELSPVEDLEEAKRFTKQQKEKAIKIIDNPKWKGGNMTKIVKEIEKIARGLSKESEIAYLIKLTNESYEISEMKGKDPEFTKLMKMYSQAMKMVPGSPKQKDMIKQINKQRLKAGLKNDSSLKEEELEEKKLAGFIANFKGKKLEIKKNEVDSLYGAKKLAIQKLRIPKSQEGLLSVNPAYESVEWDEERMDIIGQNGNEGLHYDELDEAVSQSQVGSVAKMIAKKVKGTIGKSDKGRYIVKSGKSRVMIAPSQSGEKISVSLKAFDVRDRLAAVEHGVKAIQSQDRYNKEEVELDEAVDARKKGHLSYKFGRKPDQNPYPEGSDDAKDWSAGYSAAKAAEKKRDPRYRAEEVERVVLGRDDKYESYAKGNENDPMLFVAYEGRVIAMGSKKDDQFVFGFRHESIHPNRNYQPAGMVRKTQDYTHIGFDSIKEAIAFAKRNKITEG